MISCKDAVKQLWEYLDGAVDADDRAALEEHLGVCRRCCGELEFAEELKGFLATHAATEMTPDVRRRLADYLEEL